MMSLVEAYCRLNRARGLELVSPEDLMNACSMLEKLELPLSIRKFDSNVKVLQHESFDEDTCIAVTVSLVTIFNKLQSCNTLYTMTYIWVINLNLSGGSAYITNSGGAC